MASASLALMAPDNASRVLSSCTCPSEDFSNAFASSTVLSSFDVSTAFTAPVSVFSCDSYHSACWPSFAAAASNPSFESAVHPSYSGAVAFNAAFSASTAFASLTCFGVVSDAVFASPFTSAL